jgi:hypothetical protein
MRVLVCGDRNWDDFPYLCNVLDEIHSRETITLVIEGEARGADTMSRLWAEHHHIPVAKYPADWHTYGRAAGPIRNRQMLREGHPDLVVAFHRNIVESKGTRNMVEISMKAGVPVRVYDAGGPHLHG